LLASSILHRAGLSLLVAESGGALVGLRRHVRRLRCGAPGGIRTPDPQIRSLPLYPLSYGRVCCAGECY
jgi:hypothetical protein